MENLYPKHGLCEIDRAAGGKLRNKNADESWEIIKNLTFYNHKGWNDMKEFIKPVKAIFTPHGISKTPDQILLELEDQINFILNRSQPTLKSSTHIPHAHANAVYSNPRTTFEAQVGDYMAAYTERMERFENIIFKQHEVINDRMTELFGLLKELISSKTPKKVLIREEAKILVTKNVNSISLDNTVKPTVTETEIPVKEAKGNNETKNKPVKKAKKKEVEEVLSSWPIEYYLKHRINEKLIKGLVDNNRFNDSLSRARVGK
ncbi:hypothetical protein Tco_1332719, partial [Tanacetum coccineum]